MPASLPSRAPARRSAQSGGAVTLGLAVLGAIALAAGLVWFFSCPCERVPGAFLVGGRADERVADWSFANRVPLCQIQTYPGLVPHAINLNCMATPAGRLYLSCSQCEGKRWSGTALENPEARIRLDGTVYPVTLRRVTAPGELDQAWRTRHRKLQALAGDSRATAVPPRPDHWWSFEVTSRSG